MSIFGRTVVKNGSFDKETTIYHSVDSIVANIDMMEDM